jgi:hypothetical protein
MKQNSIDRHVEANYTRKEIARAGNQLLERASATPIEALSDPGGWSQSEALSLQLQVNRLMDKLNAR